MSVKIKLQRLGKIRSPHYRVVIADARSRRDGRVIETIGKYHPKEEPSFIQIESERAQYWLGVGAQPTESVEVLLKITGDWQKFKGLPGAEGTLKVAPAKPSKLEVFNAELAKVGEAGQGAATTPKKSRKKAEEAKEEAAEAPAAEEPAVEAAAEAAPEADTTEQ
ncbi:MAG: 30S ribosomal protein S16 [Segniliparus sp.]|uniref:30S ribosomal protein S16 n=1 Tax=Segniliparus sp. TaxID=2804064 RepID=UPI003F2E8678